MKNLGASSWVSSLERKFILPRGTYPKPKIQNHPKGTANFPEQAPGYAPLFPINIPLEAAARHARKCGALPAAKLKSQTIRANFIKAQPEF
jgi:hypothetical protein